MSSGRTVIWSVIGLAWAWRLKGTVAELIEVLRNPVVDPCKEDDPGPDAQEPEGEGAP